MSCPRTYDFEFPVFDSSCVAVTEFSPDYITSILSMCCGSSPILADDCYTFCKINAVSDPTNFALCLLDNLSLQEYAELNFDCFINQSDIVPLSTLTSGTSRSTVYPSGVIAETWSWPTEIGTVTFSIDDELYTETYSGTPPPYWTTTQSTSAFSSTRVRSFTRASRKPFSTVSIVRITADPTDIQPATAAPTSPPTTSAPTDVQTVTSPTPVTIIMTAQSSAVLTSLKSMVGMALLAIISFGLLS